MPHPAFIDLDGRRYAWRDLLQRRKEQLQAAARAVQPALFAAPRADVYSRVTARIIADLEKGVRPWLKPWSAGNTEGRIVRPLRSNGQPYNGINVLML